MTIMHLKQISLLSFISWASVLFLGIVKALMACLEKFMAKYSHKSGFQEFINPYLSDITSFRLGYCMMKKHPRYPMGIRELLGYGPSVAVGIWHVLYKFPTQE